MRRQSTTHCSISDCSRFVVARGWCDYHYRLWLHHGDPLFELARIEAPPSVRFWRRVDKNGPIPSYRPELGNCWLWLGAKDEAGYGSFGITSHVSTTAQRFAYEDQVGPIPAGYHVDHLCRVHSCVRPAHLEAVTPDENRRRGLRGGIENGLLTHCPQGHAYTPENIYLNRGRVVCRTCRDASRAASLRSRGELSGSRNPA